MKKVFYLFPIIVFTVFTFANDFIDINNLQRGMKGYCLTVFHDTIIDTFQVEIIDIIKNFNSSNDIILVQCYGENIEKTGIAQGMSGSPVYFNGKLAGSLSYTWSNLKEPIAGVVPINDIIKISEFKHNIGNTEYNFKEITTPVVINSINENLLEMIKEKMYYKEPSLIAGSLSGANKNLKKSNIRPGKGIAIKIVDGDMSAYAIGTCTYIDNEKIYTLGHPMYMKGNINYPMSEAYIYSIIPRTDISFKLGAAFNDTYSAAMQDRLFGVYAVKGNKADIVNVKFKLNDKKLRLKIVNDEDFLASIMPIMFIGAISNNFKSQGPLTINYNLKIFTKNNGIINYENTISSDFALIQSYIDLQSILTVYIKNIFSSPSIDSISIDSKVEEFLNICSINDINIPNKYYKPGDIINGELILSRFRGKDIKQPFSLQIPENLIGDSIMLVAINGRDEPIFELSRSEGKYDFTNINELKNIIASLKPSNSIILKLIDNRKGFSERNKEFIKMPGVKISQMFLLGKKPVKASVVAEKILTTNNVINGQNSIIIKLRRQSEN